jgi:ribosomal protein S6
MPFYELICIIRKGSIQEVREYGHHRSFPANFPSVARIAGNTILESNGVIRNIVNMGLIQLPQRMRANRVAHYEGHYFLIRFYSNPFVIKDVRRHLNMDPRMIRHFFVQLGESYLEFVKRCSDLDRLKEMNRIPGDYSVPAN